ncbi:MAG: DUF2071 domain-containing protein, partial [Planctomycetes bacterium]|nr:DUF2071 domain-containing protein [Planctomycetota bacterium]
MLYLLKRHPFPVVASFRDVLVLTYAFPREVLEPLLGPGLTLDALRGLGFLAVALVQTEGLRPAWAPRLVGRDFFLAGYRVFARFRDRGGRQYRGLRILRSYTDSQLMAAAGNLFTRYAYRTCEAHVARAGGLLAVEVRTPGGEADLSVSADLASEPASLPEGSPFESLKEARRFAGPLPHTFDYEAETRSIVRIEGVRAAWEPRPVRADVRRCAFLEREPFRGAAPVLASAFHLQGVPY